MEERYDTFTGHMPAHLRGSVNGWRTIKVANFEMEAATLFTMCGAGDCDRAPCVVWSPNVLILKK